jgi:hypothetical protein
VQPSNEKPLEAMLAEYGQAMACLVQGKLEDAGREEEVRRLLAAGFRFLFTFSPEPGSAGDLGEVGAALFHPGTRETVPIFRYALTAEDPGTARQRPEH